MRSILIKIFNFFFPPQPWPEHCDEPPVKPYYETDFWKAQAEADEREDARQDEWNNLQYRHLIDRAAMHKLADFIDNPYGIYIGYPTPAVITISRNHDEVFEGKSFQELVQQRYQHLLVETFTPEEIITHKECALMKMANYDEKTFENLKELFLK